jgi:hypothetical protein
LPALLDLFAQHALCQPIEFFALLELRQNRGQQLIEYRNRALTGQDLRVGNDRLDELADKLAKNGLADRALALVDRGGDLPREFRGIDGPVVGGAAKTACDLCDGCPSQTIFPFRAHSTDDRPAPGSRRP